MRHRKAKMTHKTWNKRRIFMFWSTWCSLWRAGGFSFRRKALQRGLGINYFFKIFVKFWNFFEFFVIKNLYPSGFIKIPGSENTAYVKWQGVPVRYLRYLPNKQCQYECESGNLCTISVQKMCLYSLYIISTHKQAKLHRNGPAIDSFNGNLIKNFKIWMSMIPEI